MKAQFKYAFLQSMTLRLTALAIVVLFNLVFGLLGYFRIINNAVITTAVVFSSLSIAGLFVINIIADVKSFNGIFGSPEGYLNALTPVKGRYTLFARAAAAVVEDNLALIVAVCGVVLQSFILTGLINRSVSALGASLTIQANTSLGEIISAVGAVMLGYAYIIMLILFGVALKNSVFFGIRGKSWLGLLGVAAAAWVLNLLNFILWPFASFDRFWFIYSVNLTQGINAGTIVYALINLIRVVALYCATSALLERRLNLS